MYKTCHLGFPASDTHYFMSQDALVVNTRMHIVYFSQRYIICYFLPQKGCMTLNEYRGLLAACGCSAINPPTHTHAIYGTSANIYNAFP